MISRCSGAAGQAVAPKASAPGLIRAYAAAQPTDLPGAELGVEVVIESTGRLRTRAAAAQHLEAGAQKVIISAPAKGEEPADATVVLGVNSEQAYDPERHHVISNASCTTNCPAPVAKVLNDSVGIHHGLIRPSTRTPPIRTCSTARTRICAGPRGGDQHHPHVNRGRVGARPRHPGVRRTAARMRRTGAAAHGTLVDLTVETTQPTPKEEVNVAFEQAADAGPLSGILAYTEDSIVSSDIVKSPSSSISDTSLGSVVDDTQVKVVAWYGNEWGYSSRLIELAQRMLVPVTA